LLYQYTYDDRGNITGITRNGQYFDGSCWQVGQIDNLSFSYWNTNGQISRMERIVMNIRSRII
jgi:hypothetical protein